MRRPDPFSHAHRTKHAPPSLRFLLRTLAEAIFCLNCPASVCSALPAQVSKVVWPNRRISSINMDSISSAFLSGPSAEAVISRMLRKRSMSSGYLRNCSISCCSAAFRVGECDFLCFIPTVNREVYKFVQSHFLEFFDCLTHI